MNLLCASQFAAGAGIVLYWALFYTVGLGPREPPPCHFAFERAFLLPDMLLAGAFGVSGWGWLRGWGFAAPLSLAASGAMMFLGLLDISFNLQNGVYLSSASDAAVNGAVNLFCLVYPSWAVREVCARGRAGPVP